MSDKSEIGLIGIGRIGQVHAANIVSLPEISLRATADPTSPGFGDDPATLIFTDAA
jgi:hypothetical protein